MRTFLIVMFILFMLGAFTKAIKLMFQTYPHTETTTLGEDCVRVIEAAALSGWVAYLLWG